jgi:cell shape-determining protein MreC
MARWKRYSPATVLRHSLPLLVLPLFTILLITGAADGLRLLIFEPVALASGDSAVSDPGSLSAEAAQQAKRIEADADRVSLAHANNLRRQASSQFRDFASGAVEASGEPIPARISWRGDSSNWLHNVRINRGSDHGIKPGYAVTVGRTLVGVVTQCTGSQSIVSLVSDPGVSIGVTILPKDGDAAAALLETKSNSLPATDDRKPSGSLKDLSLLEDSPTSDQAATDNPRHVSRVVLPAIPAGTPEEMARALGPRQRATRGMLKGLAKANPRLPRLPIEDIDVDTGVSPGMLVVTNDAAGALPAGLLVGFVSSVSNRNTFLQVEVAAACDISLVDVVLVIPYDRPSWEDVTRMLGR